MTVRILTPEWSKAFEADAVFLPGAQCPFEVLPEHAPIISTLAAGEIRWRSAEGDGSMAIAGGIVRTTHNELTICVEEKA